MVNNNIYEKFALIAKELIALNRYNYYLKKDNMRRMGVGPGAICFELGTVVLNCGRKTGKSKFIHDNMDNNSALIVQSEDEKRRRLDLYQDLRKYKDNIIIGYELEHGKHMGSSYKTIYIDEPYAFRENIIKIAYENLAKTGEELFVIFGAVK